MTGNIKTTTFTRALGSNKPANTTSAGKVLAQRSFNPYDNVTNTAMRNKRLHNESNIFAGRVNIRQMGAAPAPTYSNSMDDMAKVMAYTQLGMQAGQTLVGLGKGIAGLFKNSGGGAGGISGGKGVEDTINSAAINAMKSATTSVDLRAAINSANAQASTLAAEIQTIEGQLPGLKEAADAAQTKINDLNKQITEKNTQIKNQQGAVTTAENSVKSCKSSLASKQDALTKADADYSSACTNYTNARTATAQAQGAYNAASTRLASTPETITGPDGTQIENPAYDAAVRAHDEAYQALGEAELKEKEALEQKEQKYNQLTDSKSAVDEAQTAYDKAADQLVKEEEKLAEAETELSNMENELKTLEAEREKQQQSVDAYENKQQELKDKKAEQAAIKAEIPAQQARLAELEKAEEANIGTIDGQIDGYQDEINGRIDQMDGAVDTAKERRLQRRNERDYKTISGLESKRNSALDLFNDSKRAAINDAKTNGETTYQGVKLTYENGTYTYNGKTYTEDEISANL